MTAQISAEYMGWEVQKWSSCLLQLLVCFDLNGSLLLGLDRCWDKGLESSATCNKGRRCLAEVTVFPRALW